MENLYKQINIIRATNKVWNRLRKIKGSYRRSNVTHFSIDGACNFLETQADIYVPNSQVSPMIQITYKRS